MPGVLRVTSVTGKLMVDGTVMLIVSCAAADTADAVRAAMPSMAIHIATDPADGKVVHNRIRDAFALVEMRVAVVVRIDVTTNGVERNDLQVHVHLRLARDGQCVRFLVPRVGHWQFVLVERQLEFTVRDTCEPVVTRFIGDRAVWPRTA